MNDIGALLGIGLAILAGASSPGPSFLVVSRISVSRTRRDGLLAAFGMGLGGVSFAAASLLGLTGFLLAVPSAFWLLKLVGGVYLIYLGVSAWVRSGACVPEVERETERVKAAPANSFLISLATHVSNPKALVVYSSVFATFLPSEPSFQLGMYICLVVFVIEFGWYAFVAMVLSMDGPRRTYLNYKSAIDRFTGSVLSVLGIKLIISAGA